MGKAIAIVIVIAAITIAFIAIMIVISWQDRKARNAISARKARQQRELLDSAARVLNSLAVGDSLDEIDILRPQSRQAIDMWLANYRKETERA